MSVKTVKLSDITRKREIAAGGEGKIYEHPSDTNKVIKVYHKARSSKFVKHLEKLSVSLGSIAFVRPLDIYVDAKGQCLGFEMDYVNFNDYYLFNNLFNKGFCSSNNIDKTFKIQVLNQLATCLQSLHKNNIVVGDLNQYNLFVGKDGRILFVDVDSYQTPDNAHSGVLLDDIRDWTTTAINSQTDDYAYDVLAFWVTTFCHPYKWVVPGNKETLEMRVKANKSILSKITGIKIPALYEPPVGDLLKQFSEIFNNGRRYIVSMTGIHVPVQTVVKQQISVDSNTLTIRKIYEDVKSLYVVDNRFAIEIKDKEWFIVEANFKGVTRNVKTINCDKLYISDNSWAYRNNNSLYSSVGREYSFKDPVFYFNNGFLSIIDYSTDIQWNFNINNQLGGGIDNTNTPVFGKSIIKRSGLLQNFGSQKYLNVPFLNRYSMIPVPVGTKDGFYVKEFVGLEIKGRNSVEYQIRYVKDANNHKSLDFDYLPHFAVQLNSILFVPEDGYIDIYRDLQFQTRLECSVCTRDSKLFSTKSGILLLESKTLYLVNTK